MGSILQRSIGLGSLKPRRRWSIWKLGLSKTWNSRTYVPICKRGAVGVDNRPLSILARSFIVYLKKLITFFLYFSGKIPKRYLIFVSASTKIESRCKYFLAMNLFSEINSSWKTLTEFPAAIYKSKYSCTKKMQRF